MLSVCLNQHATRKTTKFFSVLLRKKKKEGFRAGNSLLWKWTKTYVGFFKKRVEKYDPIVSNNSWGSSFMSLSLQGVGDHFSSLLSHLKLISVWPPYYSTYWRSLIRLQKSLGKLTAVFLYHVSVRFFVLPFPIIWTQHSNFFFLVLSKNHLFSSYFLKAFWLLRSSVHGSVNILLYKLISVV